jgi:hypothetical protein
MDGSYKKSDNMDISEQIGPIYVDRSSDEINLAGSPRVRFHCTYNGYDLKIDLSPDDEAGSATVIEMAGFQRSDQTSLTTLVGTTYRPQFQALYTQHMNQA